MPQRVAGLDLAVARLVDVPLSYRHVAILGDTALRCAAPKLVDVLALRATHGQLLADDIAEQLDSSGRWPATSLDQPAAALALACQWAVGGEQVPFEGLFRALAAGDEALLLDSGTWFLLDDPALDALRTLISEARELVEPNAPMRLTTPATCGAAMLVPW